MSNYVENYDNFTHAKDIAAAIFKKEKGYTINWDKDPYAVIDGTFQKGNYTYGIELKGRECESDTFNDTVLSDNKVRYAQEKIASGEWRKCYFVATYTDNTLRVWDFDTTNKEIDYSFKGQKDVERRQEMKIDRVWHYDNRKPNYEVRWES